MTRQFLGSNGEPKYFFSREKAEAFIAKRAADETHYVKEQEVAGTARYTILPKEEG